MGFVVRQNVVKHCRELLLRDDLSDPERHRLLSLLSLIQEREVLARVEQNARLAASAKTFKDREFYERMHTKWLAITAATDEHPYARSSVQRNK
jgi:hypothetical protein